jgi:hypothetical protein
MRYGTCTVFGLLCALPIQPAAAQTQDDIANIFGALIRSGVTAATQSQWEKLPPAEIACIDQGLHQHGSSINLAIRQGIGPADSRVFDLRSSCRNPVAQQPPVQPLGQSRTRVPLNPYAVDGLALGGRVSFDSAAYRQYQCGPSDQFAGLTWCQKKRADSAPRGQFTSSFSILHSADGTVSYVNRYLEPAWFAANEANEDISRLTRKYGLQPYIIPLPQKPGAPNGMIAVWGDVILEPVDTNISNQLAAGNDVRAGLMIDHIGNFRRSAQLGLPIYRLLGGAGYVWAANWDQDGRGTLRFLAIDASSYTHPTVSASKDADAKSTAEVVAQDTAKTMSEPIAAEKAAERAAADKAAADRAAEKAIADQAAADRAGAERAAAEKAAAEKEAADRAAAQKAAAEEARRKAEMELARQNELHQRGVNYAALSETDWTIARKQNEMTDQTDITVESVQKNELGIVVEVQGTCKNQEVAFSALIVDSDGKPSLTFPGRTSFGNAELGSGIPVLYRINDSPAYNTMLPSLEFTNKFQVRVFGAPGGKSETPDNTARLLVSMLGANIYLKPANVWRVMVELKTSNGAIIVKIPVFDASIQELMHNCK